MKPINITGSERILITRADRIGDLLISTPVFEAIKKKYPKVFLAVLVLKENQSVVVGNPWIDEVIIFDKKGRHKNWIKTFFFGLSLRKQKFDIAIHLHATNRVNIISWAAGIPVRIGYKVVLGRHGRNDFLLTHKITELKWHGRKHEAEYNFDLLKFIHVPQPEEFKFFFPLVNQDLEDLTKLLPQGLIDRYVVFHPSASCVSKRWPSERFANVADRLAADYDVVPIIIGEDEGIFYAGEMESKMNCKVLNLSGKLRLGMLAWLLKGARLLVSNDSGPVHLAVAVGTPVISIFGRSQPGLSPTRWRPLSANGTYIHKDVGCVVCLAHKCEINFKCLTEILVDDVLKFVKEYEPILV